MIDIILAAVFGLSMGIAFRQVRRCNRNVGILREQVDRLKRREIACVDKEMIAQRHHDLNAKIEKESADTQMLYNKWMHQLHQNDKRVQKLENDVVVFLNSDVVGKK
jgi:hypothetical protein